MSKFKGFIVTYVNLDSTSNLDSVVNNVKNLNKDLYTMLKNEGYEVMFIPVSNESTRVEKVDLQKLDGEEQ